MIPVSSKTAWRLVSSKLEPGQRLTTWSMEKEEGRSTFTVQEIKPDRLTIKLDSTGNVRTLSSETFEKVGRLWDGYLAGKVQRQEFSPLTHHSSYAFGILHAVTNGS